MGPKDLYNLSSQELVDYIRERLEWFKYDLAHSPESKDELFDRHIREFLELIDAQREQAANVREQLVTESMI